MARGLATLILVVFILQGITFASGLGPVIGWFTRTQHILWGLLVSFLLLFTHTAAWGSNRSRMSAIAAGG